jgi:hypothetical protein
MLEEPEIESAGGGAEQNCEAEHPEEQRRIRGAE